MHSCLTCTCLTCTSSLPTKKASGFILSGDKYDRFVIGVLLHLRVYCGCALKLTDMHDPVKAMREQYVVA